jgi:hypothetical protein
MLGAEDNPADERNESDASDREQRITVLTERPVPKEMHGRVTATLDII